MDLLERYESLKKDNPRIRAVEAARQLECTELDLLLLGLGSSVHALDLDRLPSLLNGLHSDTKVMFLTRNDGAVHEYTTLTANLNIQEELMMLTISNNEFLFKGNRSAFAYAYVVSHEGTRMPPRSIQVFDAQGVPVWKVYIKTHASEFDAKARKYYIEAETNLSVQPARATKSVYSQTLRENWGKIQPKSYAAIIEAALLQRWEIQVEVMNAICTQSFSSKLQKTVPMEGWFNIMDPNFNLHLRQESVQGAWTFLDSSNRSGIYYMDESDQPILKLALAETATPAMMDAWHALTFEELIK